MATAPGTHHRPEAAGGGPKGWSRALSDVAPPAHCPRRVNGVPVIFQPPSRFFFPVFFVAAAVVAHAQRNTPLAWNRTGFTVKSGFFLMLQITDRRLRRPFRFRTTSTVFIKKIITDDGRDCAGDASSSWDLVVVVASPPTLFSTRTRGGGRHTSWVHVHPPPLRARNVRLHALPKFRGLRRPGRPAAARDSRGAPAARPPGSGPLAEGQMTRTPCAPRRRRRALAASVWTRAGPDGRTCPPCSRAAGATWGPGGLRRVHAAGHTRARAVHTAAVHEHDDPPPGAVVPRLSGSSTPSPDYGNPCRPNVGFLHSSRPPPPCWRATADGACRPAVRNGTERRPDPGRRAPV
jgi:hypothetical protein